MLACATIPPIAALDYPVLASPKMDGIRCLMIEGKAYSRSLKLIPNRHVQKILGAYNLHGLDGELMLKTGDFNDVQSAIMSENGEPDFEYVVFDSFSIPNAAYSRRLMLAITSVPKSNSIRTIPMIVANTAKEMQELYAGWLIEGYEGAIARDASAPYKYGRSTLKQGWMLKIKEAHDAEAEIIGYVELNRNGNEATIDELGHTKRSHHKDNKFGGGTLGSLVCRFMDVEFYIGTGFDAAERDKLWKVRETLIGKTVTFRYQELHKSGVPRFPSYKGLRYE